MPDVFSPIGVVWTLIVGVLTGYSGQRRNYFDDHVEPLQQQLTAIHHDYIAGFQEVRRTLKTDGPTPELVEFLRGRRRDYDAERQLTQSIANEIANTERAAKVALKGATWDAVTTYCTAVGNYFVAEGSVARSTWFSHYMNSLEMANLPEYRSMGWATQGFSNPVHRDLTLEVDRVLDVDLPAAWRRVTDRYAELRRRLL